MNVIETSGLGKRYGRTCALRNAALAIPAGYVVALVGPNGAGKTTLLHMSVGLTRRRPARSRSLTACPPGHWPRWTRSRSWPRTHRQVQVAGEELLACHSTLTGPAAAADDVAERPAVYARRTGTVAHLLVRNNGAAEPPPSGWEAHPVGLEELVLAYLREPGAAALPGPRPGQPKTAGSRHDRRRRARAACHPAGPGAVDQTGLGHLAAAPGGAGRCGRTARWPGPVPADHGPEDPQRLSGRGVLPPDRVRGLRGDRQAVQQPLPHRGQHGPPPADDPRARRGVRRRAAASPGAGDRDVPVRLDPGLRPAALGGGQAGAARHRGHRGGRRVQPAVLLVLPAVLRRALRRRARAATVQPARGGLRRLDAARVRPRRRRRGADRPHRARAGRVAGRVGRARPRHRALPAQALPDALVIKGSPSYNNPLGWSASGTRGRTARQ